MTPTRTHALCGVLVCFASVAPAAHDFISTKVTWTRDISRIVLTRCIGCHVDGGRAPMPLTTYEEARPWARAMREQVLARRMPKWHAARGYGDFANDPSLSPFEIALIAAWVDGGAPKGTDPATPTGAGAVSTGATPAEAGTGSPARRPPSRQVTLPCTEQPLSGRLLAVNPQLPQGGSAGIAAQLPNGRREVVAWIRGYEPEFPTTYWLRTPLLLPRGTRLQVEPTGPECALIVTMAR